MSIEAVGQNGAVLGSDIYWNQLNSSSILGGLMQWTSGTEYYRTLQEAAARASTAIEEIYDDLQQNIGQICLVPSSPRSTLAKQVESLYNVCEMVGILNRHSRECQRILELRDLSASIDPFMESALQTAHQKMHRFFAEGMYRSRQRGRNLGYFFCRGKRSKEAGIFNRYFPRQ